MGILRLLIIASATLVVLLAGCERGPDSDALRAAIQTNVRSDLSHVDALANTLGGHSAVRVLRALGSPNPDQVRVAHVTVLHQTRLDDDDYDMRVRYDLITPNGSDTVTRDLLLQRTGGGHWKALPHDGPDNS